MSTKAGESQIHSLTTVNKANNCNSSSMTEKCSTSSKPASVGASGEAAQSPSASTTTKSVAANLSNQAERNTRSPQNENQNLRSDRVPKGANYAVSFQNRFGRWRTGTLLHRRPLHAFVAFRQENKKGGYLL